MGTIRAEQVDAMGPNACAQCQPAVPAKPAAGPPPGTGGASSAGSSAAGSGAAAGARTGSPSGAAGASAGSATGNPAGGTPVAGKPVVVVDPEKPGWLLIELVDETGTPMVGEPYKVGLPNGRFVEGALDAKGAVRIEGVDGARCTVAFPQRDDAGWRAA
jgi:hypothetical protein